MDTDEFAKVQRLEQQLQRVTSEALNEPFSLLKFKVNEEEKVIATSRDEQHFGGRKKARMGNEGLTFKMF